MALSKNSKTYRKYEELYDKYEKKLKRMQFKDREISPEDFGFDRRSFEISAGASLKEVNKANKQLQEFLSRKNYMKKIGTTTEYGHTVPVYMSSKAFAFAKETITEFNDRRLKVRKALSVIGKDTYRLSKGKLYKRTLSQEEIDRQFETNDDLRTRSFYINGGKYVIGDVKGKTKRYDISAERFKEEYTAKFKGKLPSKAMTISEMNERLKNNFFVGLENKFGESFTAQIKELFKELRITTDEFIGMFYSSGVFDFTFIYADIDLKLKKEQIKTETEKLRDNPKYKTFVRMINEE